MLIQADFSTPLLPILVLWIPITQLLGVHQVVPTWPGSFVTSYALHLG
jgi:hypothetical protein